MMRRMVGIVGIAGIVGIVGRVIRNDQKPIFNVATPGTSKVAGFGDGKPIEKTVQISGPRTDVTLR